MAMGWLITQRFFRALWMMAVKRSELSCWLLRSKVPTG